VTGPTATSDARLRRAQALALGNGVGLEICRKLIDAKLDGQERLARDGLKNSSASQEIASYRERLCTADTFPSIRVLEAHAAVAYFAAWRNLPVLWPKADCKRIPDHWRTVGSRHSPLSGGPRLAVTPVHAILNYCFALLESETRLAVVALGLDPSLGLGLHTDRPNRDSLPLDVLEPVRVEIERWVLNWITREPLRKSDFFEATSGNCRLTSQLCSKLGETASVWSKLAAPWVEYVARTLWASTSPAKSERRLSTPLTQQHRRLAKGRPAFPNNPKPGTPVPWVWESDSRRQDAMWGMCSRYSRQAVFGRGQAGTHCWTYDGSNRQRIGNPPKAWRSPTRMETQHATGMAYRAIVFGEDSTGPCDHVSYCYRETTRNLSRVCG